MKMGNNLQGDADRRIAFEAIANPDQDRRQFLCVQQNQVHIGDIDEDFYFAFPNSNFEGGQNVSLQEVENIIGKEFGGTRIFSTKSHREIYSKLLEQLQSLSSGNFKGTQGTACFTLVGAKGIGKSCSLKYFTQIAKHIYSSTAVAYISFGNATAGNMKKENLLSKSISERIISKLSEYVPVNESDDNWCVQIVKVLRANNLFLLILVDEIDQLYKTATMDEAKLAVSILHELTYFGDQSSGRIAVVLCSSSTMMENLVTTYATDQIREEFPLLRLGAPNMNGTKYRTIRVHSTLPTDLASVASVAGIELTEQTKPFLRLIAYSSGCCPRKCEQQLRESTGTTSPESSLSGGKPLTVQDISLFHTKLLQATISKNRSLLHQLFGGSMLRCSSTIYCADRITQNIASINWEERFRPLAQRDVDRVWAKMIARKQISKDNQGNKSYYILHLADRCWLTFDGIVNAAPARIYPFSLESLGQIVMTNEHQRTEVKTAIQRKLKLASVGAL